MLVQLLYQRDSGIDEPPGKLTVRPYLETWLTSYAQTNAAPKTFRTDADIIRRHLVPALGALTLTHLRPMHIQDYSAKALTSGRLDGKGGLSARSVVRHHQVLHAALEWAVKWQLLARNPADAVKPPTAARKELRALTLDELHRLVAVSDATALGSVVRLGVLTGLRQGELLGLRGRDIDVEGGELHVQQVVQALPGQGIFVRRPKTAKSRRAVALSPDTVSLLRSHRRQQAEERLKLGPAYDDHDLVFATPLGTPIDPSNLRRTWRSIVKAAEVVDDALGDPHLTGHIVERGGSVAVAGEDAGGGDQDLTAARLRPLRVPGTVSA